MSTSHWSYLILQIMQWFYWSYFLISPWNEFLATPLAWPTLITHTGSLSQHAAQFPPWRAQHCNLSMTSTLCFVLHALHVLLFVKTYFCFGSSRALAPVLLLICYPTVSRCSVLSPWLVSPCIASSFFTSFQSLIMHSCRLVRVLFFLVSVLRVFWCWHLPISQFVIVCLCFV